MKEFTVAPGEDGRADVFISHKYPEFSRSGLSILFEKHLIKLGAVNIKPSHKLKIGDEVIVDDSMLYEIDEIDLPIIYEDKDVIVVDKPEGILTHGKGALSTEGTVASFIKPRIDKSMSGNRAGIVHRLDRGTSGLIIAAKTEEAQRFIQKQFSTRKVGKTYLAVVQGELNPSEGIIDMPIARDRRSPKKFTVSPEGKSAQTSYQTVSFISGYSLAELKPKTGRTHQLRVHLSQLGHPILGDQLYSGTEAPRMMLHATKLELRLPTGEVKLFESNLPKEFSQYE